MPKFVCEHCGEEFFRWNRRSARKFCGQPCYQLWKRNNLTGGRFEKGIEPWNKGTKGVMRSNSGSFQKGVESAQKQPIGAVTIRTDKSGKERAWAKISDNGDSYDWMPRAVLVWRRKYGPIPRGKVVHHKDRNTLNDVLSNLELVTRGGHLSEHRPEFEERRLANASAAIKKRHAANRLARKQDS